MAGKRSATSDLNHDNWDREETPEEAGTFKKASDDSLKQRVIKTARRRNPISSVRDSEDSEKKSAFIAFTGFGKAPTPTTAAFSFLSNINTPPKVNGTEEKSEKDETNIASPKYNTTTVANSVNQSEKSLSWTKQVEHTEKTTNAVFTAAATSNNKSNNPNKISNDYFSKLKGLNQTVSTWIKKHVDTNPLINLQPIFRDYEKYFEELEKEKILKPPDVNNKNETSLGSFVFKPTTNVPDSTTEKSQLDTSAAAKPSAKSTNQNFSFGTSVASTGVPLTTKPSSTASSFSFGTSSKESSKTTPSFSFGANPNTSVKTSETSTSELTKSSNNTTPSFTFGAHPAKSAPFAFSSSTSSVPSSVTVNESTNATIPLITFGVPSSTTTKDAAKSSFTFGSITNKETTQAASTTTPLFSFGSLPSNKVIPPFSTSSPFVLGNTVKPIQSGTDNKDGEEEAEVPPSNEFTPVVEKDHVYTVRCKVFVIKDGTFGERGVGSLYLKPIPDSEKFQLIVRADTNLGNVLLNFILSESIPTKRLGNKDVMLVCVPVPEVKPPPVPVLIRVKSAEEADKLLETLEKHKK